MPSPISPRGYRRLEPTPNDPRFLKHDSQIPIEDYEEERNMEDTDDVVTNLLRRMQNGDFSSPVDASNYNSASARYAQNISYGDAASSNRMWEQINRKFPVDPQAVRAASASAPRENPAEDFFSRIQKISNAGKQDEGIFDETIDFIDEQPQVDDAPTVMDDAAEMRKRREAMKSKLVREQMPSQAPKVVQAKKIQFDEIE